MNEGHCPSARHGSSIPAASRTIQSWSKGREVGGQMAEAEVLNIHVRKSLGACGANDVSLLPPLSSFLFAFSLPPLLFLFPFSPSIFTWMDFRHEATWCQFPIYLHNWQEPPDPSLAPSIGSTATTLCRGTVTICRNIRPFLGACFAHLTRVKGFLPLPP